MKNRISANISYLMEKNSLSQKEFGELFGLKQGVISAYIRKVSNPQLDTLIDMSEYFEISIDDLLLLDLSKGFKTKTKDKLEIETSEYKNNSTDNSCKMCSLYERMLADKERLIKSLERENILLRGDEKRKGA